MEHHEQKQGSNYFRAGQMKMNNAHRYYIFSYISYYIFSSFNNTKIEIETKVTDAIYQILIYIFGGHQQICTFHKSLNFKIKNSRPLFIMSISRLDILCSSLIDGVLVGVNQNRIEQSLANIRKRNQFRIYLFNMMGKKYQCSWIIFVNKRKTSVVSLFAKGSYSQQSYKF